MRTIRRREMNGFKIKLRDIQLRVYFDWWNDRAVRCILKVESDELYLEDREYEGRALCNIVKGDVFNLKKGQCIAFEQALDKFLDNRFILCDKVMKKCGIITQTGIGLIEKFNRVWDKEENKE
jgi:uncharacterized protein (DUF1015 family)